MKAVKTKPWEDKEIQSLIEGYKTKTMKEMAEELKRPEGSIRNKIYELTKAGKIGKKPAVKKATKATTPKKTVSKPAPKEKKVAKPVEKKAEGSADALAKKLIAIAKEILKTLG